jgi:hypothetical protein
MLVRPTKSKLNYLLKNYYHQKKIIQLLQEDLRTFKEPPHATNTEHQDERINPQVTVTVVGKKPRLKQNILVISTCQTTAINTYK